jgi:hypothetical protein
MKILAIVFASLLILSAIANVAYGQQEKRKIETISIPYTAANTVRSAPEYFDFSSKHEANWILSIRNELIYNEDNPDAKIVLRLKENAGDTEFVEIGMFSPRSHKLFIAVSNEQLGYMPAYESDEGWLDDKPITTSLVQNERFTAHNGQRIVLDRLQIGPLVLGTIEVFGMDTSDADLSAFGGHVLVDVISGNPLDNPIMIVPFIVTGAAVGTVVILLKIKRR